VEEDVNKTLLAWLKTTQVGLPLSMIRTQLRALAETPDKGAWRVCINNFNKKRSSRSKWDWGLDWLKKKMTKSWGFSFRVGTTAARKLPPNHAELHDLLVQRLAYEARRDLPSGICMQVDGEPVPVTLIPSCLIVNSDQGGVPMVGLRGATWAVRGVKAVPLEGGNDKRQVTVVLASDARGDMVPLQVVVEGKSKKCVC
jgi:hypothetical protein